MFFLDVILDVFLDSFLGVYEGSKKHYFVQETFLCITFDFTLVPTWALSQLFQLMHRRLDLREWQRAILIGS